METHISQAYIFKSYKSNKQFNKICPILLPWQLYLCNALASIQNFQTPCSSKQKLLQCRKLWYRFLCVSCTSSLPTYSSTPSKEGLLLTQGGNSAPTSKLCLHLPETTVPWHQGPGNPEWGTVEGKSSSESYTYLAQIEVYVWREGGECRKDL